MSVFCEADQWVDVKAGTPIYIAPEVLRSRYSLGADVWGVGVVAYQLLTGRLPFAGEEGAEVAETYMSTQVRRRCKEESGAKGEIALGFTLKPYMQRQQGLTRGWLGPPRHFLADVTTTHLSAPGLLYALPKHQYAP